MPNDPLSLTPHPRLLLVLNGPRGVGKRVVAAAVARHLRGATVFDPDAVFDHATVATSHPVGVVPHTAGAPAALAAPDDGAAPEAPGHRPRSAAGTNSGTNTATPHADHRAPGANDPEHRAPARRRILVADAAEALRTHRPGPILMPATLLDRAHCEHLLDLLVARGFDVRHVTLHLDRRDRRARIGDDEATASGRAARRARLGSERRYERARPWLHAATLVVDTTATSPDTIAVGLAEAALRGSLPTHRGSGERIEAPPDSHPITTNAADGGSRGRYRATNRGVPVQAGRFRDIRRRNG
ncbi:hypothetical protein B4N89_24795 [Embleya scabrispora]|uniref:Uncharacterized protein n=1 Tax=Embleya scabrispora TaxID=159449 RepID=A0A1T3P444_9ACTN|nr:hypothetical protein [Embleya scabrispora]OPC83725.1 hypothetical protein B4N89_24795 [Embleya scabrispora]